MDISTFKIAKSIQDEINNLNNKKLQIEKLRERNDDDEFNFIRQIAHDYICYSINRLTQDFEKL